MTEVYAGSAGNKHSVFRFRRGKDSGFDKAYMFMKNNTVVISTFGGGEFKNKQNLQNVNGKAGWQGAKGPLATWDIELEADKTKLRIKSTKSGKYLRIKDGKVDVDGGKGPFTLFQFHKVGQADNALEGRLQSCKEGTYLNVGPTAFTKHYMFAKNNVVVLKSVKGGKCLRVSPGDTDNLDCNGGIGQFAQWHAELNGDEISFKSAKTGKYLRIGPKGGVNAGAANNGPFTKFKYHKLGGGKAKFESKKHGGKFPAFRDNKVQQGNGGPFTEFEVFRQ